jgi:hypothetical protein
MTALKLTLLGMLIALSSQQDVQPAPDEVPDQRRPTCPRECNINMSVLNSISTNLIIGDEYTLHKDSCQPSEPNTSGSTFKFLYTIKGYYDDVGIWRRTQNVAEDVEEGLAKYPNKPNEIPPHPKFNQTLFGWRIEIDKEKKLGSCYIVPGAIGGPFPQADVEACIDDLNLACYRVKTSTTCPCFNTKDLSNFMDKLNSTDYDPSFVLDMDKSCKDEGENNGLPYGLYTKKDRYEYEDIKTLQFGTDVNNKKMMDRCHRNSRAPQIISSSRQHGDCVSKINDVCSKLKILPKDQSCSDEENYEYKSKKVKTCNRIVNNHLPRWKVYRNCNRYDYNTSKFVSQHCRKSCHSCTCRTTDDPHFRFNGMEERSCAWVASLSNGEKDDFCQDNDVATKCQNACGKGCCQDTPHIRFTIKSKSPVNGRNQIKRMSCEEIGNMEWMDLCKQRKVARYCPMKCRLCSIQPRMRD